MLDEYIHKVWGLVVVLQHVYAVQPYTAARGIVSFFLLKICIGTIHAYFFM